MSENYREDTVAIEVRFPAPVNLTREHQRRLIDLIEDICSGYEAHHPDRIMWAFGIGGAITSMPITKEDEDSGVPLEFDMSIFNVECAERERYDTDRPKRTNPNLSTPSSTITPDAEKGACELCAGECRGHRLGHPEDWEPEPGSAAATPAIRDQALAAARRLQEVLERAAVSPVMGLDMALWSDIAGAMQEAIRALKGTPIQPSTTGEQGDDTMTDDKRKDRDPPKGPDDDVQTADSGPAQPPPPPSPPPPSPPEFGG